jgi:hypothetical protein
MEIQQFGTQIIGARPLRQLELVVVCIMPTPAGTVAASSAEGDSHAWEDTGGDNLWDKAVQEDEDRNNVVAATDSLTEAVWKRRELLDYAQRHRRLVRDMIRYVYVVIDTSRWARVKDPVSLEEVQKLVKELYCQSTLCLRPSNQCDRMRLTWACLLGSH